MSNEETNINQEIDSIFDLPQERRAKERVRIANELELTNVGANTRYPHAPIEFIGDANQTTAFLDLVQASTPSDRLAVILESSTPDLKADPSLISRINQGIATDVSAGGQTTVISISCENYVYHLKFGYSEKGVSTKRNAKNGLDIVVTADPASVVDQSLFKLYQLTGKANYVEAMGVHTRIQALNKGGEVMKPVDPDQYYSILGLNPYALRYLSDDMLDEIVIAVKKAAIRNLHPDTSGHATDQFETDHFQKVLAAAEALLNPEKRKEYTTWLK